MPSIPRQGPTGLSGLGLAPLLLSVTAPVFAQGVAVVDAPFRVAGASGAALVLTPRPDLPTRLEVAHGAGELLVLADLPLAADLSVGLALRPVSALEVGARALVVDAHGARLVAPRVATFSGYVEGRAGTAFLAVSPTQVQGYVSLDGELFFITSGGSASGRVLVTPASALSPRGAAEPFCRLVRDHLPPVDVGDAGPGEALAGSGPVVRIADVFIEVDHDVRALFSSDQDAIDYAALLIGASNEIYRRDLGTPLRIPDGYLRLWTVPPPWGDISGFSDIQDVQAYWTSAANPLRDIPRASVHVLTNPVFGGVAWNIGGICDDEEGYEVSSIYGTFPYPIEHTSDDNWDLLVVSHEFGHSFGSPHTFDYSPPIDCDDGTGPDHGTLMGYCHGPFGVVGVGMRFHAIVQDTMRAYIDSRPCLEIVSIQPGDYDYDGDRDAADLAAFDAYLTQGFHSEGSRETFDMDGDGAVTGCDRRLLDEIANGPGQSYCFGAGCPCGNDGGPCEGCASSTGAGGSLAGSGSSSVAADDLVLTAAGLPMGENGIFFMGSTEPDLPFGDGRRCVGGQLFRFPVRSSGPAGAIVEGPGIVAHSHATFGAAGRIAPGQTWSFQCWHRDPAGPCGSAFNVSSAYRVTFSL